MNNDHYAFYSRLGETSAGKSSMLNIILGEKLLPFSVLSTTSTISELKYGREKRVKAHYNEEGKAPKIQYLKESSPCINQVSEFVHVKSASLREKTSSYKKTLVSLFNFCIKRGNSRLNSKWNSHQTAALCSFAASGTPYQPKREMPSRQT